MAWRGFGSDNHAGAHPEVLAALLAANEGHAQAYGDDDWTARAVETLRRHLGEDCDAAFVFNGTGANCVALAAVCRPWHSVICPTTAHINCDEAAAPERIAGIKLIGVATPDGKLTPAMVAPHLEVMGFEHAAQPRVISVSNVSELGTVYTAQEIRTLAEFAHAHGMLLHVDGARIANAAAALNCGLREITVDAGVDVLSLGATKNGLAFGDAVVLFGSARSTDLVFARKQLGQLASKMRYVAAQFEALFAGDLWLESARHANVMAARLAEGARSAGVALAYEPQANEVFMLMDESLALELGERFHVHSHPATSQPDVFEVRCVCAWDTQAEEVDEFISALGA